MKTINAVMFNIKKLAPHFSTRVIDEMWGIVSRYLMSCGTSQETAERIIAEAQNAKSKHYFEFLDVSIKHKAPAVETYKLKVLYRYLLLLGCMDLKRQPLPIYGVFSKLVNESVYFDTAHANDTPPYICALRLLISDSEMDT